MPFFTHSFPGMTNNKRASRLLRTLFPGGAARAMSRPSVRRVFARLGRPARRGPSPGTDDRARRRPCLRCAPCARRSSPAPASTRTTRSWTSAMSARNPASPASTPAMRSRSSACPVSTPAIRSRNSATPALSAACPASIPATRSRSFRLPGFDPGHAVAQFGDAGAQFRLPGFDPGHAVAHLRLPGFDPGHAVAHLRLPGLEPRHAVAQFGDVGAQFRQPRFQTGHIDFLPAEKRHENGDNRDSLADPRIDLRHLRHRPIPVVANAARRPAPTDYAQVPDRYRSGNLRIKPGFPGRRSPNHPRERPCPRGGGGGGGAEPNRQLESARLSTTS